MNYFDKCIDFETKNKTLRKMEIYIFRCLILTKKKNGFLERKKFIL